MWLMKLKFSASSRHLDQALKTPESMAPASSPISSVSAASSLHCPRCSCWWFRSTRSRRWRRGSLTWSDRWRWNLRWWLVREDSCAERKKWRNKTTRKQRRKKSRERKLLSKKQTLIWQITDLVPEIFIALSFFFIFKQ